MVLFSKSLTIVSPHLLCHHSSAAENEYWLVVLEERHLVIRLAANHLAGFPGGENRGCFL